MRFLLQRSPKNLPLRWVLIAPFVVEVIVSTGLIGWLSFRSGTALAHQLALELGERVATEMETHVEEFALTHQLFLNINAAAIRTQSLSTDNLEQLESYFWQQVQLTEEVSALYYADRGGNFVLVTVDGDQPQTYIRDETTAPLRHIYNLDEFGNRTTLDRTQAYDPRDRPWYRTATATEGVAWSEIYTFAGRPLSGITPVIPMYDSTGELEGVLAADITLNQLSRFLQNLDIGKSGQAFIVEHSGHLVASSSLETPLVAAEVESVRRTATQSHNDKIRQTAQFLRDYFGRLDHMQSPRQLVADFDGAQHVVQIVPIQAGQGLDWIMVVAIPLSEFMEQVQANARSTLMLCGLAIAVVIGSTIGITYWITKPVFILNDAAQAIAAGELKQDININCVSEINRLAQSFNYMAGQLQSSFSALASANQTLELQVAERTHQLERLAMTDSLTQVLNRRGFNMAVADIWQEHIEHRQPITLMMLDIDYFKAYNDCYGHVGGDECLQTITAVLRPLVKGFRGVLGRYGGEEFVIALPSRALSAALAAAAALQQTVREAAIAHGKSPFGIVTVSIGITSQIPQANSTPTSFIERADLALYRAKSQGRNQIVIST
ncbi:MAG: diguanylate cyclase [Cyanobacteria bacterium P01_H01_bin.119]